MAKLQFLHSSLRTIELIASHFLDLQIKNINKMAAFFEVIIQLAFILV